MLTYQSMSVCSEMFCAREPKPGFPMLSFPLSFADYVHVYAFSSRHERYTFYTSYFHFSSIIHVKYLKYVYFSSEFKIFICDHRILHPVTVLLGGLQV